MKGEGEGRRRGATGFLVGAGGILLVLGVTAFALGARSYGRTFSADPLQGAIHAASGILLVLAAFVPAWRARAPMVAAIALLGLGVLGTLTPRLFGYPERLGSPLRWEVGENAAHLILGSWGAYVATRTREKNETSASA